MLAPKGGVDRFEGGRARRIVRGARFGGAPPPREARLHRRKAGPTGSGRAAHAERRKAPDLACLGHAGRPGNPDRAPPPTLVPSPPYAPETSIRLREQPRGGHGIFDN